MLLANLYNTSLQTDIDNIMELMGEDVIFSRLSDARSWREKEYVELIRTLDDIEAGTYFEVAMKLLRTTSVLCTTAGGSLFIDPPRTLYIGLETDPPKRSDDWMRLGRGRKARQHPRVITLRRDFVEAWGFMTTAKWNIPLQVEHCFDFTALTIRDDAGTCRPNCCRVSELLEGTTASVILSEDGGPQVSATAKLFPDACRDVEVGPQSTLIKLPQEEAGWWKMLQNIMRLGDTLFPADPA